MTNNYLTGKILERIVKYFLAKQGYCVIPENLQNHYGIGKIGAGLTLKGRGAQHQIDALGQFQFRIPFVYPIRLLCEAKCYSKSIGLEKIRNYVGVLKDISENYTIENSSELVDMHRFLDCAAIFSTSKFTKDAQMYAFAQGIYLIELKMLKPLIEKAINEYSPETKKDFFKKFDVLNNLNNNDKDQCLIDSIMGNKEILFGHAEGIYPVVIFSKNKFPKEKFLERDEYSIKIYYNTDEDRETVLFTIKLENWEGVFELPKYLWEKHLKSINYREEMIDLKKRALGYIDIPLNIRNMRRIIRLNLDKGWLDSIRN